jgi:nucleoside-diphosphate-sugar epimerase
MKVLITGASGFIGTHLLGAEAMAAHELVCPVRRSLAATEASRVRYLPGMDLNGSGDWSQVLRGCDAVIHLAGRAHVMRERASDPLAAFRAANVEGTLRLARAAVQEGVRRFVFVSSVKVNGECTQGHPFRADDAPRPMDAYALSKYEAECRLRELAQGKMETVIVRPPLVYGAGVRANFQRLMQAVLRGLPLPFGAVDNRRSLLYAGNLADMLATCLTHPNAADRTWLVSDNEDLSTAQLVRLLAEAVHKPARLLPIPPALLQAAAAVAGKRMQIARLLGSLQVDVDATMQSLQWRPPYSARQGLALTAASFQR